MKASSLLLALVLVSASSACASAPPPCASESFEGALFTVCEVDPATHDIRLMVRGENGANLRTFEALEAHLGANAGRVRFAMNAGMFDEDGDPIGLYIEEGQERRSLNRRSGWGNFHLLPNGVFSIDARGRVRIETTEEFAEREGPGRFATQSGPMLLIDGALHPAFQRDGQSRLIRNGVGAREDGRLFFVISEDAVSFGRMARFMRDTLHCVDALYFDGSVSSLWAPQLERRDANRLLGPFVIVLDRPQPAPRRDQDE